MKLDVLFINPSNQRKIYQTLSDEFTAIATPSWTALLAGNSRKKGYSTAIYDVNIEGWDDGTAKEVISRYNPGLVVMMVYGHQPSASTQTMPAAGRISADIKDYNRDIVIAMGGTHPSALPARTLKEEAVDYVIQGTGVYTIEGLLRHLNGKTQVDKVRGLWLMDGAEARSTGPSEAVLDLDSELDDYAWDLLPDMTKYRAHNWHCFQDFEKSGRGDFSDVRMSYAAMNTSLGCPYTCSYCCINAIFDRPRIRYWPLERIMAWLDTLVNKFKVRNIRFDDELFILAPQRVEGICDMIIERGYDLNIFAYGRVDTIKPRLMEKLRRSGIRWICLGIESANEKVREGVNKKIKKEIREVVRMIQDNGINVLGNYMFGLPDDTIDTMEETLRLAMELNCEFANFYTVMAYPGSLLYEWASQKDGYLPESWQGYAQHGYEAMPLPTRHLSSRDVLKFRDEAYIRYFTNPGYLRSARKKFGEKVESHIRKMTEIRLKRRLLEVEHA